MIARGSVEHQAVTLSTYTVELQDDHKHLQAVSNPRLSRTPFRSPQLALFDLGPHEWLLYWRTPERTPKSRRRREVFIVQLSLFDPFPEGKAVGAEAGGSATRSRPHLHLVGERAQDEAPKE
jgi:hypothetical protein